jgi:hypothetical protein
MSKLIGALRARTLLMDVLEKEKQHWTCSYCGVTTTVLSEICSGCGVEDCEQGKGAA